MSKANGRIWISVKQQHHEKPYFEHHSAEPPCTVTIEPRPDYCDRGRWIAKLFPAGEFAREIDHSDGWPRYYFEYGRAIAEVEAWLEFRAEQRKERAG